MTVLHALDRITVAVATIVDIPAVVITVVRDGEQVFAAAHGLGDDGDSDGRRLRGALASCREVAHAGRPIVVQDARRALRRELDGDGAIAGYACVPIIADDHVVIGTLAAFGPAARTWHDRDVVVLRSLAEVAAVIIDSRRLEPRHVVLAPPDDATGDVPVQEEIVLPARRRPIPTP